MKRFLIFGILALIMVFTLIPVFAEEAEVVSEPMGDTVDAEDFNEIMTELYRHWQTYTETEGDNGFEKLVNFAWKYRGDVGGVVAAVSVIVFLLVMTFRFMPRLKRYFEYIYDGNAKGREEIMNGVTEEISKYAPALATVEAVAEMYPKMKEAFEALLAENASLKEMITEIGERVSETERRHAAEMKLQGATFKDIITLSALPVGKKTEILENYRVIESGEGEGTV